MIKIKISIPITIILMAPAIIHAFSSHTILTGFYSTPISSMNYAKFKTLINNDRSSPSFLFQHRSFYHHKTINISTKDLYQQVSLANQQNSDMNDENSDLETSLSSKDQILLGSFGTFTAIVTLYSEFILKATGCGLPAGPFGLVGAIEGISYLSIVGVAAYAIVIKLKTGNGLPAGPGGILGLAEGLSFLSILFGLLVLGFQITDYGYIPNAVPMEGGMCK